MKTSTTLFATLLAAVLALPAFAQPADSAVADAEADAGESAPASLSAREHRQLLAGRGMGAGRPAVAQGYPGPMHMLRQAEQLELDEDQIARTGALRQRVHSRSRELGRQIVDAEHELDALLAATPVDRDAMRETLGRIAKLRAEFRAVHLEAHLDQAAILTPTQLAAIETTPGHGRGNEHGMRGRGGHGMHAGGGQDGGCNCGRRNGERNRGAGEG